MERYMNIYNTSLTFKWRHGQSLNKRTLIYFVNCVNHKSVYLFIFQYPANTCAGHNVYTSLVLLCLCHCR